MVENACKTVLRFLHSLPNEDSRSEITNELQRVRQDLEAYRNELGSLS